MMAWWPDLSATISRLLDEHGLLVAFVLLLLEESGVPSPIPGDVLMIVMGVRAATGGLDVSAASAALMLATVSGGSGLYWISRWGGRALVDRLGHGVGATPDPLDAAAATLRRRGARAVVLGRLLPGLAMMTTVTCGLVAFPYRRFLPALALGGLLRLSVFMALGYVFGPPILEVAAELHVSTALLGPAAVVLGLALWLARGRWAAGRQPS